MKPFFAIYRPEKGSYSGGFEQLLRQEKTLYEVSNERTDAAVTCFEGIFPDWAYAYVDEGGTALVSGADSRTFAFDAGCLCRASVEWIDLSFCGAGKARISTGVSVFAGHGKGELTLHEFRSIKDGRRPGFYPVFLYRTYGKGRIIYSGVPFSEILTYEGSTLRNTNEILDFDERISSVDKQKIGRALKTVLMEAMREAGFPYLSLWYFPDGARSVFAYSIDGDGLLSRGVDDLIEVSEKTGTKFLFYINRQLCQDDPELIDKLKRIGETNLIGSHAALHNAHDSYEENIRDIEEFEQWMDFLGIAFEKSFAAPRGMYCHNLGRALKDKGFRHSRDFGYAIDDYPFYPMNNGKQDVPLQIPCDGFNVCRWILKNEELGLERPTGKQILDAYRLLIDRKLEQDLPLLFFCHPQYFGLYAKEIYPEMVAYAKAKGALVTDYISYGDFWIKRDGCEYVMTFEGGKMRVELQKKDPAVRLCIDGKICDPETAAVLIDLPEE